MIFAERFDSLMKIAEVSNSMLARAVFMNSSHIGRLRTGARPLSKKHEYLVPMCLYLAEHIKKDYQFDALKNLTGIGSDCLNDINHIAEYLEYWLLEKDDKQKTETRLVSGASFPPSQKLTNYKQTLHLYGNAGKRKAVEQFFLMILEEKKPQTILLFSDENMAWLYEDPAFAGKWARLFKEVIARGNRVRIIHNVSRDLNEIIEAVTKWIPIYVTGMLEPYYYSKLRDGVFQHTLFIAPNTAAVISSSVKQTTEGRLNLFITDPTAIKASISQFEDYFSLCSPLMQIFPENCTEGYHRVVNGITKAEGASYLYSNTPPFFALSPALLKKLSKKTGNEELSSLWEKHFSTFQKYIKNHKVTILLPEPSILMDATLTFRPPLMDIFAFGEFPYSKEDYLAHYENLKNLTERYQNLKIETRNHLKFNMMLYVKEGFGVLMTKTDSPMSAFFFSEPTLVNAFWDYLRNR